MDAAALILYAATVLSVAVLPGPSMALAFAHGARFGVLGTVPTALGNVTATLMQAGAAYLTLRTVSAIDPRVFAVTQGLGAVVLMVIGVGLVRTALRTRLSADAVPRASVEGRRRFLTGVLITVFNPKAVLFFVALFPQFVEPGLVSVGDLAALFLPLIGAALLSFMVYAGLGTISARVFGRSRLLRGLLAAVGALVTATGLAGLMDAARDWAGAEMVARRVLKA
jgi:threonine/homoserine/homoserine lactone efflux protein